MGTVNLKSDFVDYYDEICGTANTKWYAGAATYNRFRHVAEALSRGRELAILKSCGIATVEIKAVRAFSDLETDMVLVYTNDKLHGGLGKTVMKLSEARLAYPTHAACKFYTETEGMSLKTISVGCRKFRVQMFNRSIGNLCEQELISVTEVPGSLNYLIALPIYSIDYVSTSAGIIATDFNMVQKLSGFGVDKIMKSAEVTDCIYKSMTSYNIKD